MDNKKVLSGTSLAGMSQSRDRVENDYYATPFDATREILKRVSLTGSILEPACGEGHISKVIHEFYPDNELVSTDLIQRNDKFGCSLIGGVNFLTCSFNRKFNNVITNPPFQYCQEFIEKALKVATDKVLIFAKLVFLEGQKRKKFFEDNPPKNVYVFSKRVNPLRNGSELDENGKPFSSTICFAWFEWDVGYKGPTTIQWI